MRPIFRSCVASRGTHLFVTMLLCTRRTRHPLIRACRGRPEETFSRLRCVHETRVKIKSKTMENTRSAKSRRVCIYNIDARYFAEFVRNSIIHDLLNVNVNCVQNTYNVLFEISLTKIDRK